MVNDEIMTIKMTNNIINDSVTLSVIIFNGFNSHETVPLQMSLAASGLPV